MEYDIIHRSLSKSNPARVALTVKTEEAVIFSDQVDLTKADKRSDVVAAIVKANPGSRVGGGKDRGPTLIACG